MLWWKHYKLQNPPIKPQLRFEKCLRPELFFVWDIDLQNDEGENIGISQDLFRTICKTTRKKSWDIPRLQFEKSWDIPKIGGPKTWDIPSLKRRKKMGYPKKLPGELLSDATGSVAEMGFQNGNRHFAKRISPIKSYH